MDLSQMIFLGKLDAQGAIVCDGWDELIVPYLEDYKGRRAVARYYAVTPGRYDERRSKLVDLESRKVQ